MELFKGRPSEERTPREERCYALLDSLNIEYYRVDHESAADMDACKRIEGVLGCEIVKNLLLTNRQQTDVYLLLMPGDKPFKTKILSKQLGVSRLSFATEEQMLRLLDVTPGSVSVLGLMNDSEKTVRLIIDGDVLKNEYIGAHPCLNTSTLKLKTEDVTAKLLPAVGHSFTAAELPWVLEE